MTSRRVPPSSAPSAAARHQVARTQNTLQFGQPERSEERRVRQAQRMLLLAVENGRMIGLGNSKDVVDIEGLDHTALPHLAK